MIIPIIILAFSLAVFTHKEPKQAEPTVQEIVEREKLNRENGTVNKVR